MIEEIQGCFAKSLAGHDKGSWYVITKIYNEYVFLCDGKLKTVDKPKRKKIKHIQVINCKDTNIQLKLTNGEAIINEDIRKAIKNIKSK